MRIDTLNCLAFGLLLAACERATPSPAPSAEAAPSAEVAPSALATPAKAKDEGPLAQVREDVPLPLSKLLGHSVEEVQAQLGPYKEKAMMRKSCFRSLPARTHFTCRYALQEYTDKTGNYRSIRIAYENGVASAVAYDGWVHGSGTFTPEALLTAVGLTLPGPGKLTEPAPGVRLWTWFNSQARLLIDGKQHRVEVSIIDEDWSRTRVEVIMNHPLTPEQQALVVMVDGKSTRPKPDESTPEMSTPDASTPAPVGSP